MSTILRIPILEYGKVKSRMGQQHVQTLVIAFMKYLLEAFVCEGVEMDEDPATMARSEVASGSSRQRVAQDTTCSTQIHSHNDVGSAHNRNPLQTLRDSKEKDSGSFRLRTSRLEAQNLALYAQNAKLIEQNRQYVADLDEAHKRAAKHESMLTSLRTANTSLKKTMIEQSQENARLIAENAKLKMQTRQNSTNVASDGDEK
ncbi:hypothetical protein PHMEG_00011770 [Phytophthora megakarya]|uniref:Uncharacterized protein n=1 Tax=Phytophthora megakarya TaxID=4795 RepID=A0A225WAS3_9STRA|nr:hypothetical protein PHMEG_00011770 [Phytophthora megakarya]